MTQSNLQPNDAVLGVIFDYGKVLSLAPTAADWQRLADACDIAPVERFQQLYWQFRDAYDVNVTDAFQYWNEVGAAAGQSYDKVKVIHLIALDNNQWTRENHGMIELSRRLRRAGIKTAVLSNIQWDMLAVMRAKFAWLDEFETRTYSCEHNVVKPEAEIYLLTCRNLGLAPKNVLFLDDKQVNIDGAHRAGLQAMLFDTPDRQQEVESYLRARGFKEEVGAGV
ncbi:MAG TPA: HAD-IA family hydrolase [Terriglobales bacterium]